ncbi:MAG: phospho-sugar mutase [Bacteroidota bacterium]
MTAKDKASRWLQAKNLDDISRAEVEKLVQDSGEALDEAFLKDLEFGTGGLRGIMGIGSNRVNKYTIGMATQGFSNYLQENVAGKVKVAIAHDSRNNSKEFARITADVFSANGIEVYLFSDLRPTPELSFAIRHLGCSGGVVLTASHNPKEYNGYKAYWSDGGQLISPHDKNVIQKVTAITSIDDVKFNADESLIHMIDTEVDGAYLDAIQQLLLSPNSIKKHSKLKIVYSSIHGTGITLVPQALKNAGFENIQIVEEQATANGNFPTVVYPNPEEKEAMSLAIETAQKIDADLIMATDPDADRVGIAVKNQNGKFELLNGNQTGALLVYYLLKKRDEKGLQGNEFIAKTIVTSELIKEIADAFAVSCYDTLTGFKFIAELIKNLEGKEQFVGGGEESYGYLIGDAVRDKDAVASCLIIAELAAWAADQGKTVYELLYEIYRTYGFYQESLLSVTKKGLKGAEEIKNLMADYRNQPPKTLAGSKVIRIADYLEGKLSYQTKSNSFEYPKSNVLQFFTEDGSKVSIRPSGTEPKIKFYFSVNDNLEGKSVEQVKTDLEEKIVAIRKDLKLDSAND